MTGNYRPRRRPGKPAGAPGTSGKRGPSDDAAAKRDTARRANLPRRTAYDVLAAVRDRAAYANLLLPKLIAERRLAGRDAALATELAYGTLRGQGTYDAVLAACSDRPLAKLDPPVLDILRLGAHQLLNTRVGAHAAVATSVDLAKSVIGPRVSGYVNAVLRRVAMRDLDAWLDIVAPVRDADPDARLAIRYSHPAWIVAAYRAALGDAADAPAAEPAVPAGPVGALAPGDLSDAAARTAQGGESAPGGAAATGRAALTELEAALAAGNARPRVTMAAFPSGPPREDVMPAGAVPGRWSPYAFTLESGDPAPLIEAGTVAVQDEGSQLAAIALSLAAVAPRAGRGDAGPERWLDLCAGPGGKSRLLYGLALGAGAAPGPAGDTGPRATLTAAELHPHRAALVRESLARASRNVAATPPAFEVLTADGTRPPWGDGTFDRALVDVPCSGLGALRRRPEARWRKSEDDLKELTALQRDLLRSALKAVRPGGVVAYVTCSPVPAETSDVVTDVAASVPGTEVLDTPAVLRQIPSAAAADPRFAQLWPHRHGTDAIFIALLRRGAN
jgi:16S rRNA (cytosine967-C5)-methyltransferase